MWTTIVDWFIFEVFVMLTVKLSNIISQQNADNQDMHICDPKSILCS
jgi:hypothetical protein